MGGTFASKIQDDLFNLVSFETDLYMIVFLLHLCHDRFTPDVISGLFTKAVLGWTVETILLKSALFALGSSDAPLLDMVA